MRYAPHVAYVIISMFALALAPIGAEAQSPPDPQTSQLLSELRRVDPGLADALAQILSMSPEAARATGLDEMLRQLLDGQVDAAQLNRIMESIGAGSIGVTGPVQIGAPAGGGESRAGSGGSARPSKPVPSGRVGVVAPPPPPRRTAPERPQPRQPAARPPSGDNVRRQPARSSEPTFAERVRAANERAVADFRRNARTIRIRIFVNGSDCDESGESQLVDLQLEGFSAPRRGGITQYVTGAWFGTLLPYVEGFGGIQGPTSSGSGSGQWNSFGCGRDREYVITYDTRRFPNGPNLRFRWFDRWREGFASDNGIFTITVRNGGRYYYRGNTRRR